MVAMLAGCAGVELEKAEKQSPVGSAFQNDLYAGYIDLSFSEYAEGDYRARRAGLEPRNQDHALLAQDTAQRRFLAADEGYRPPA